MFIIYILFFIAYCIFSICGAGNIGYEILMSHKFNIIGSICVFGIGAIIYNIIFYFLKVHYLHMQIKDTYLEDGYSNDLNKYLDQQSFKNLEQSIYAIGFWLVMLILLR